MTFKDDKVFISRTLNSVTHVVQKTCDKSGRIIVSQPFQTNWYQPSEGQLYYQSILYDHLTDSIKVDDMTSERLMLGKTNRRVTHEVASELIAKTQIWQGALLEIRNQIR